MASPLKQLPRRLFELLQEQQEPFLLEINGCSSSKSRRRSRRCWRLRKPRTRILRGIITKFVCWKATKRDLKQEWFKLFDCCSGARCLHVNAACFHRLALCREFGWQEAGHSPVSVLELHSDGSSSDHNHCKYTNQVLAMEEENPSTSRFSAPPKPVRMRPRQLLFDFLKEREEKSCDPGDIFYWNKQRGDGATMSRLLELDLREARGEWITQFNGEKREIGVEIGGIIFEEMREQCVFDMLGSHYTFKT